MFGKLASVVWCAALYILVMHILVMRVGLTKGWEIYSFAHDIHYYAARKRIANVCVYVT